MSLTLDIAKRSLQKSRYESDNVMKSMDTFKTVAMDAMYSSTAYRLACELKPAVYGSPKLEGDANDV